jgi:DNA-binding NarL/FixJ family response regulator
LALASLLFKCVLYCACASRVLYVHLGIASPCHEGLALPGEAVPTPAKILIVDDQELVRRTLRSLLGQQRHWKIYEASDGQEAIDETRRLKPDVAILDIVMPLMSGIEAAYEMRRLAPDTKIILMSSHYTPEEAATLARLFGDGNFVAKSEMGKDLVPAISRILRKKAGAV